MMIDVGTNNQALLDNPQCECSCLIYHRMFCSPYLASSVENPSWSSFLEDINDDWH